MCFLSCYYNTRQVQRNLGVRFPLKSTDYLLPHKKRPAVYSAGRGYDMAKAANMRFAAAGWSNGIPEIEAFMRQNCDLYFKTVEAFGDYLLHGKEA